MKEEVVTKANKNKKIEKENKQNNKESSQEKDYSLFKRVDEKTKAQAKVMKEMEIKEIKRAKTRKRILIGFLITLAVVILIAISTIFAVGTIFNDKIISGVSISGIEVSGLSKEEAKGKLEAIYNEKMEKEIGVKYQEYETTLNPQILEVNYEIEKAVEEAFLIGKKENIFVSNYEILFTLIKKKNIDVNMTLNEEITRQTIEDIGVKLPGLVLDSSYSVEDDELIISKGKKGIVIDTENLLEKVKSRLKGINIKEDYIEIPVKEKEPEPIDIEKIHSEICREAKDAYYTKDPFTVHPEVEGISFDLEAAKVILAEDKEEYVIKLTITKPKITLSQIGDEAFPDRLSTYTTRYDSSNVDRSTNLRIACQKINGKVILPGETFSYNKALGERTAKAGYRNGKIYVGGEVVDGLGGGICQISSTLYNAVLEGNLEVLERRNHQFTTAYIPVGRDATVVYGVTDFRFKNTRKYPVRISASAKNGIATVSIYGIKEAEEYTFSFSTKVLSTIAPTTKYEEDSSLPVGTEKVKQQGANGQKTETYITKKLNGKVISTKLLSRDTYDAMPRIIVKGTKGATNNQQPTTPQTPSEPTPPVTQPETPTTPEQPTTPTEPVTPENPTTGTEGE